MKNSSPILMWFRRDLRLSDNPALRAAVNSGRNVIPIYILPGNPADPNHPGGAARWWLHHSLNELQDSINKAGSKLTLRKGSPEKVLPQLLSETKADTIYANKVHEPGFEKLDANITRQVAKSSVTMERFDGHLMIDPETMLNRQGKPYQVFTPFWRACQEELPPETPLPAPRSISGPGKYPKSLALKDLDLLPQKDWASGFPEYWKPGESGAKKNLKSFLRIIGDYEASRNKPGMIGTSRISPHLHYGEISARTVWHAVCGKQPFPREGSGAESFLREVGWREFAYYLLHHFPHTVSQPLREKFSNFPWEDAPDHLAAWQQGKTGYPIVDAGMRELWKTGWMHNRVRMIVASFLVKDLRISWLDGAAWFMDTLVDADLASNTFGWQWTSGCGADAAPYFRIFNPVSQGEKFDPEGTYVRKFIPELSNLPRKWIHKPWQAPSSVLKEAEISLGETYPAPIIDHAKERNRALAAFRKLKG